MDMLFLLSKYFSTISHFQSKRVIISWVIFKKIVIPAKLTFLFNKIVQIAVQNSLTKYITFFSTFSRFS